MFPYSDNGSIGRQLAIFFVIGSSFSLIASSQLSPTDEENKVHEQQKKTLDYEQAIVSKYSYPLAGVEHRKLINLVNTKAATLTPKRLAPPSSSANKCIPILTSTNAFNATGASYPSLADLATNVSFPVRNINMPVAPASGSINSALRLLSTFDKHLSGSSDDAASVDGSDSIDDDDEGGDDSADVIEGFNVGDNLVRFRHNRLRLQGLNLTMLNIHIYTDSEPKLALGITIKNTTLTGRFVYDGPTLISDTKLAGYYRMSIDNIYLVASSNLTKKTAGTQDEQCDLATNEFKLNITNLGYISIDIFDSKDASLPTTNYLLRMMQRLLQRTIKRTYYTFETYIRETLEGQSRKFIDCELTRFSPMLLAGNDKSKQGQQQSKSQFSQSDLARIINGEIERSHMSTVGLPTFDYQQSIFGTSANINFNNGSMSGLDNLVLDGETRVKLQDEHLIVNASIGWQNLRPYYSWRLHIGPLASPGQANATTDKQQASRSPISKGFVAFNIKAVSSANQ